MSSAKLLDVKDLRVAFGGKEVVHGIAFDLAPGEKLALVGESGSGKTVSALSLLGLVQNADVTGSARCSTPARARRHPRPAQAAGARAARIRGRDIAMIFQEPMTALNPLYSVGDQIAEVLELKDGLTKKQAWDGAIAALRATGIPEPERRAEAFPAPALRRPAPARHDRHGAGLPAKAAAGRRAHHGAGRHAAGQILDLLADLQRQTGMAVLLITHDLNLVRRFADRVAVMENGHLVEQGPVDASSPTRSIPTPAS
jgi:microcin C transport system ATP-binding protein